MNTTRLNTSFEQLWRENPNQFVLRYRDISDSHQTKLSIRIKKEAPIRTITRESGPSSEMIKGALMEINPIIFAEEYLNNRWQRGAFSISGSQSMSGWHFRILCQGIFKMLCRKKKLTNYELKTLAQTTCQDWRVIEPLVDSMVAETPYRPPRNSHQGYADIGIQEIARLGRGLVTEVPLAMQPDPFATYEDSENDDN